MKFTIINIYTKVIHMIVLKTNVGVENKSGFKSPFESYHMCKLKKSVTVNFV